MPCIEWLLPASINVLADYRAWGKAIHDAILACGLVQTADTGQIDWATAVLGAATSNAAWGYQMYRFNDAAQATAPIFIKLEYGRGGSTTADVPNMWITVGRSVSGTGTVTSNLYCARVSLGNGTATASGGPTSLPSFATGDGSGIFLALHTNHGVTSTNSLATAILVERSRDASGVATPDGLVVSVHGTVSHSTSVFGKDGVLSVAQHSAYAYLAYMTATTNGIQAASGGFANTAGISKDPQVAVSLAPVLCAVPGVTPWYSKLVMLSHPGDCIYSPLVNLTRYGGTHTYRLFPHIYSNFNGPLGMLTSAMVLAGTVMPAMLWDA